MINHISERHDTIISLLSIYCKENITGLEAADTLKDLVMISGHHKWKCLNKKDFISSDDFMKEEGLLDALRMKLITTITKL